MNIKDRASKVRQLRNSEAYTDIVDEIRQEQVNVFLNPSSSIEDREVAHNMVCALEKIERRFDGVLTEEALFDKRQNKKRFWQ